MYIFRVGASRLLNPVNTFNNHLSEFQDPYQKYDFIFTLRTDFFDLQTSQRQFQSAQRDCSQWRVYQILFIPQDSLASSGVQIFLLGSFLFIKLSLFNQSSIRDCNYYLSKMELSEANLSLISRGAGSAIYLYGQPGQAVVLKMVKCNCKQSRHLLNEYTILKQLHHQYIITPFKFKRNVNTKNLQIEPDTASLESQDSENSGASGLSDILVLQHAQKGSLMHVIKQKRLSVTQLRLLFSQLCEAVQYLHCNYIVHRDLKLQNVLVGIENAKLSCKLADFGFAASCYTQQKLILFNSYKGTKRGYMAPEIHETLTDQQKFYDARKSDVFALGVIMFAMFLGRLPFQYAKMQNNLYKLIVQEKFECFWAQHDQALRKLDQKDFSMVEDFKDLFISMVRYNPNQRVNMQDVIDSDWLNGKKQETLA